MRGSRWLPRARQKWLSPVANWAVDGLTVATLTVGQPRPLVGGGEWPRAIPAGWFPG